MSADQEFIDYLQKRFELTKIQANAIFYTIKSELTRRYQND